MTKTSIFLIKENEKKKKAWPDFSLWGQRLIQGSQEDESSKQATLPPALYVVATPIGHLGDLSLRALWTLSQVDAVLCEDTRVTGGLLHHYGIKKPLLSCHDHNEASRSLEVMARIAAGERLALVSDAGTPLISDPGFRLVRACRQAGHEVIALPGASAVLTALASSGLPTDRFLFAGFLPVKTKARQQALQEASRTKATLVFYESAQRLAATLADMVTVLSGTRMATIARELTKLHEEVVTAPLAELALRYAVGEAPPKGEIVILVEAGEEPPLSDDAVEEALRDALKTLSVRDAAASVAAALGLKKTATYQKALNLVENDP